MNTKHFLLNLQSGSTLSKLRNFGGGGLNPPNAPPPSVRQCLHSKCGLRVQVSRKAGWMTLTQNTFLWGGLNDVGTCFVFQLSDVCKNLTFMGPCITNVFPSATKSMQRYTIYLFLWNTQHVSGDSSAHHQELKTIYTTSATLSNHLLLPATVAEDLGGSSAHHQELKNCIYCIR